MSTNNSVNNKISSVSIDNSDIYPSTSNTDLSIRGSGTGKVHISNSYKLPNVDGTATYVLATNGSGVVSWVAPGGSGGGSTLYLTIFTSNGTYTPTPGMTQCLVELVGGGGGGGGADVSTSSDVVNAGGGGGGAGYAKKLFTAAEIGASQSITIGNGGAPGSSSGGNGGSGTTTSFGSLMSASGGLGGFGSTGETIMCAKSGGTSGEGTGGDVNFSGLSGGGSFAVYNNHSSTAKAGLSGMGGSSQFSAGATPISYKNGASGGGTALDYGGGGSGAISVGGSAVPGGAGSPGIVIITEYA